jgi:hypothetical protein
VAKVKWKSGVNDSILKNREAELNSWLMQRLNVKNVVIKRD